MKKPCISFLTVLSLILCCINVYADSISVTLNGAVLDFDVPPQIISDRTFVPMRKIFESLGADVLWDAETKTVTGKKGDTVVNLSIGSDTLIKNGVKKTLDVAPKIVDERTLVPVRAIAESFDCDVEWIAESKTVKITAKESNAEPLLYGKFDDSVLFNTDFEMQTITKLHDSYTFNTNDFTIVKDELWVANIESGIDPDYPTHIHRYKMVDNQFIYIGKIRSDFGHLNVFDYSEENDCLVFGNGANDTSTSGNYFVVVKDPLSLPLSPTGVKGNEVTIEEYGIKYDVDVGYKVNALWGDDSEENNIVYLLSNDLRTITKVMLDKDENGKFIKAEGTAGYTILETRNNLEAFGVQGADIFGDTLYVGGQVGRNEYYAIRKVSLTDYTGEIIKTKMYKPDGTFYRGTVQGICISQPYVWVFCNSDAPTNGICCFLTQYRAVK
jgi:hypothetical protein